MHGTDLFDALLDVSGMTGGSGVSDIRLSLYHPATHAVKAVWVAADSTAQ